PVGRPPRWSGPMGCCSSTYPAAPCKGRITVAKEDLACLGDGEFLNDVIIDFYLKYLLLEGVGGLVAERSHIFSSFFYKQLTLLTVCFSVPLSDRHTRHQRVKTWTRHVDIFTKDFLFVPVNQEAHWFLVVICFPGLEDVHHKRFQNPTGKPLPIHLVTFWQLECLPASAVFTRTSLIITGLFLDSLLFYALPLNEFTLLANQGSVVYQIVVFSYLQVEWEVRRGTPRLFTPDSMRSSNCRVPLQDNSSDCGLYLLQYSESFLQNPVVHFDLPVRLESWFPRQRVRQKRKEIHSLIMRMHQSQNTSR
uniref:Ubiquitin-like protease family profile domain-containing protein n=1 Tax=Mola mola TaxID=94237 RepID=A0A3Q3WJ15_MOLML